MMDDIRPPRGDLQRRDYSVPPSRPAVHRPQPEVHPAPPAPIHHPPAASYPSVNPHPPPGSVHHSAAHTHHHTADKVHKKVSRRYLAVAAILVLSAGLFTAGYIFKSNTPDNSLPSSVVKKAAYNVYFPSPMPAGYTYVSKTATFQIGSVFYRFADGSKSVTVREEPVPAQKPDLSLYKGYALFNTSAGQAAMGKSFGQPVAVIVTPKTVITMNTSGGVAANDLKTAIDNLKNIGQKS